MKKIVDAFKNRILIAVPLLLAIVFSVYGFFAAQEDSVALEQLPRCGMVEHIHSEECYLEDFIICSERNHVHGENCYLLRLSDNDINGLLAQIDSTDDNSLEALIFDVLRGVVDLSHSSPTGNMWTLSDDGNPMTNDSVRMLNSAISDGVIKSNLVLNENLITAISSGSNGTETFALLAAGGEYGITPLAVGGTPSSGTRAINFYIVLDGELTFINSGTLTYNNSNNNNQARKEYCSYAYAANAYTSVLVTDVSQTNIGNGYYFRYTTSEPTGTGSFGSSASYISSNIHFANTNNPQYAILSSSSRRTTPINFYTVTLDMSEVSGSTQQQYVESGMDSTFTLSDDYLWYDDDGNLVSDSAIENISAAVTLHARPKGNTVSFVTNGGTAISRQIIADGAVVTRPADPTREGYFFDGWYTDSSCNNTYDFDTTVYNSFSLYAKWTPRSDYTFTYIYSDTNANITKTEYANNLVYDTTVILPDLPAGFVWFSEGESFAAGDSVTVKGNRSFTSQEVTLTVSYNINFPSTSTISVSSKPTVLAYTGPFLADSSGITVLSPSSSMVVGTRTIENGTRNCVAYFAGWTVSTPDSNVLIRPGIRLTWKELTSYADSDGNINFVGTWNTDTDEIVRFFVRLDSTAADYSGSNIDTSSSKYTGEIFTTYVGGEPDTGFKIEDDTPDNSYTADKEIRSLLGERSNELWIYSVPTDEFVFENLRQYTATNLSDAYRLRFVDTNGNTVEYVDGDELDSNHYAIRWYVFKHESDGWHIDGRLVKKEGVIHVEKTFAGAEELIAEGKEGFHIVADHSDSEGTRKVLMKLSADDSNVQTPSGTTETIVPYSVSDDGLTYIWHISDVEYGEEWTITENRSIPENASVYTEYSIYDSKGSQSAISRYGTSVSVTGVTYAPDEGNDHILRAEFRNFYLGSDSIAIKKEDGKSGQPISGASFELWQQMTDSYGNKNWIQLLFSYDENGNLVFDQENGTVSRISTGATGYSEILIQDFSYDAGPVLVREVDAPAGYVPAPEIVLQAVTGGIENEAEIATVGGDPYDPSDADDHMYAEYYPDEKVLVVKNYSQTTTTISAKKTWVVPEELQADSVTVELYANGVLASSLVPSIEPIVELKKENNYNYVWNEMPTVINGQGVTWSIKETKVGTESLTVNGSFVNWIDTYNRYETRDADGNLTALTLEVSNDIRRTMLNVEKTDVSGLSALAGARFRLQQLSVQNGAFAVVSGGYDSTGVSDTNGWVSFDNLAAGYYLLTELSPPMGYEGLDEGVFLYVDASGKIKQVAIQEDAIVTLPDGEFEGGLSRPNDFVIRVPNQKLAPLPTTGGKGNAWLYLSGALLVAYVAAGFILRLHRKDGDADA